MVTCQQQGAETLITLQPNRSASRRQNLVFLAVVGGVTFSVALFWGLFGAWMVLPFAGLEIAVLTYVTLRVTRFTCQMQVIRVTQTAVDVEEGEDYPVRHWKFVRPDAHVSVRAAVNPVDSIGLMLDDGRLKLELGAFLNQADRLQVRDALKQSGLMVCHDQWWKP